MSYEKVVDVTVNLRLNSLSWGLIKEVPNVLSAILYFDCSHSSNLELKQGLNGFVQQQIAQKRVCKPGLFQHSATKAKVLFQFQNGYSVNSIWSICESIRVFRSLHMDKVNFKINGWQLAKMKKSIPDMSLP